METIYTTLDTLYSLTAIAAFPYLAIEFMTGLTQRIKTPPLTPPAVQSEEAQEEALDLDALIRPVADALSASLEPTPNPKSCGAMAIDLSRLGIRQLRILARDRGVRGAARLSKSQCLAALT